MFAKNASLNAAFLLVAVYIKGYLNSLPDTEYFDVATSILISHFIINPEDRINYFSEIALRLRPESYLMSDDLASDMASFEYKQLLDVCMDRYG